MATKRPRITITLNERQHAVLQAISKTGGQSMSAFVAGVLEAALPTLERMGATFQVVHQAHEQERARFVQAMDRAQQHVEPLALLAVNQLDLFLDEMTQPAPMAAGTRSGSSTGTDPLPSRPVERKKRGEKRAVGEALTPRTNRGVTPHPQTARKPASAANLRNNPTCNVGKRKKGG